MRLRGLSPGDNTYNHLLWETHRLYNEGVKAFCDALLTIRAGLQPSAICELDSREVQRRKRIMLSLCWLTVESADGAPAQYAVLPGQSLAALRGTLERRAVPESDILEWLSDCNTSLNAAIRTDCIWVDRARAFDDIQNDSAVRLIPADCKKTIAHFWGSVEAFLSIHIPSEESADPAEAERLEESDFRKKARDWISKNWGPEEKDDVGKIDSICQNIIQAVKGQLSSIDGLSGDQFIRHIAQAVFPDQAIITPSDIYRWIGLKSGRPSAGRVEIDRILNLEQVSTSDAERLIVKLNDTIKTKRAGSTISCSGAANWIRRRVDSDCPLKYRADTHCGMLNQALRRISSYHSWVKLAETERERFSSDLAKGSEVPAAARAWLEQFGKKRSLEAGSASESVRISRQAIVEWKLVVETWESGHCQTADERVAAVRSLQAQTDKKIGDTYLFEALAEDSAQVVWKNSFGKGDPDILKNHVAAEEAAYNMSRFKVPAYCHPDPLTHPVFVEYGTSRMHVEFAARNRKKKEASPRQVCLDIFSQRKAEKHEFIWQSKRLANDIMTVEDSSPDCLFVPRLSRLGIAAADSGGRSGKMATNGLYDDKNAWGARLQAPRKKLEEVAAIIRKNGGTWNDRARQKLNHIHWFLTLSAKLEPAGPMLHMRQNAEFRAIEAAIKTKNQKRQGKARIQVPVFAGKRILSVDLGHRFAAAAVVWEAVSAETVEQACRAAGKAKPGESDIYLRFDLGQPGNRKAILFRRIAADISADGNVNPAPWARLERQFFIKLDGERSEPREASVEEMVLTDKVDRVFGRAVPLGAELMQGGWFKGERRESRLSQLVLENGWTTRSGDVVKPMFAPDLSVVALTHRMLETARIGLQRHGDRARIANGFITDVRYLPGGKAEQLDERGRKSFVLQSLQSWQGFTVASRWKDTWAEEQWSKLIVPLAGGAEDITAAVANIIKEADCGELARAWQERWEQDDKEIRSMLRKLKDFVVGRGAGKNPGRRGVGGLSIERLSSVRELFQLQKAFHMRPQPDDLRANVPSPGDASMKHFGQEVLDDLECMRTNRVKAIVSRIVEAALGVGAEPKLGEARAASRPPDQRFKPCHCVVIENLRRYKPDAVRMRRENRQLLTWSAAQIRQRLSDECMLHGLQFKEIDPAYTSRQDSRTGAGGMRCQQVMAFEFINGAYWRKTVNKAEQAGKKSGSAYDSLVLALDKACQANPQLAKDKNCRFLIPVQGGELFISSGGMVSGGLQADLNAAANIGLKILQDPDWPGSWWYVPCDTTSMEPLAKTVGGSAAFSGVKALSATAAGSSKKNTKNRKSPDSQSVANRWSDVAGTPINERSWMDYHEYWGAVERNVCHRLEKLNDEMIARTLSAQAKLSLQDLPW